MKKAVVSEKSDKSVKAKKKFLKELQESIGESNRASRGEEELGTLDEAINRIERKHGGRRDGAGRKAKAVKKVTRGVKLTEEEHKAIIKKYGSFAKGVRSLIAKELVKL